MPPPPSEFSWDVHPARERLDRTLLGVAVILVMAVLSAQLGGSLLWGIVAILVLIGFLNRFFFPSRFSIDAEGLTAAYPFRRRRFRWADVRRIEVGREGGLLSSRVRSSAFALGDVELLFGEQRDAALVHIREHLPEGVRGWD